MKKRWSHSLQILLCSIVIAAGTSYAREDVAIYLFPRAEKTSASLLLGDIARIYGGDESRHLALIPLDPSLYSDGYIDRKEIRTVIAAFSPMPVAIHGSAVRIVDLNRSASSPARKIGNGEKVVFVLKRNGVMISVPGISLGEGSTGDAVSVRLSNRTTARGIVTDDGYVVQEL
jgi:hypothetical protein